MKKAARFTLRVTTLSLSSLTLTGTLTRLWSLLGRIYPTASMEMTRAWKLEWTKRRVLTPLVAFLSSTNSFQNSASNPMNVGECFGLHFSRLSFT